MKSLRNPLSERGRLSRRQFTAVASGAALAQAAAPPRPNILWISCEDTGPHIGAYGDAYADTPNLDRLAARSLIYRNAWSTAPVCAPARTTLITGVYPTSTGAHHMRSMTKLPAHMRMFPCLLQEAGYYVSNNVKEDYNVEHTGKVWDESSNKAHWRNRKPGQPFFSVFNFTVTHESQIRRRPHKLVHDPAKVRVPAYHPDTPEVRHDWAQYYDNITTMDGQAQQILQQLEQDGLAEETIVFFFGDHGSGMPRNKRWPYNCGLNVPLIVHIPEKFRSLAPAEYRPGGSSQRLVGFIDFAPTVLSLLGLKPPAHMQGRAFLGAQQTPEPPYQFAFSGRMGERYDMVRSVRDKRYVYVRNYMPHRPQGQYLAYLWDTPTTPAWKALYDQGKLRPPQSNFWEPKPPEELYDLSSDRDEVNNLAASPAHREVLTQMRRALDEFLVKTRDTGFLPEDEIHSRSKGSTPHDMAQDGRRYPVARIMGAANLAASMKPGVAAELTKVAGDPDSAARYWAASGFLMRGAEAVKAARPLLNKLLGDPAPSVRIVAAEALGLYGSEAECRRSLAVLIDLARVDKHGLYVAMQAITALDMLDEKARPVKKQIEALPLADASVHPRMKDQIPNLVKKTLADLS